MRTEWPEHSLSRLSQKAACPACPPEVPEAEAAKCSGEASSSCSPQAKPAAAARGSAKPQAVRQKVGHRGPTALEGHLTCLLPLLKISSCVLCPEARADPWGAAQPLSSTPTQSVPLKGGCSLRGGRLLHVQIRTCSRNAKVRARIRRSDDMGAWVA